MSTTWGPTKVAANGDDGNEVAGQTFQLSGLDSDGWVLGGRSAAAYSAGLRFTNVTVPKGATIDSAYLIIAERFYSGAGTINCEIYANDIDDAVTFAGGINDELHDLTKTTASVGWDIPIGSDTDRTSPDIKTVIKEIVDRAGWASGNDLLLLLIADTTAGPWGQYADFNYDVVYCARLTINYTEAGGGAVTGDAIHSQQPQTQVAAGKQTLAGIGTQAQKVQTHAAAGKQTLAGVATHAQQRQTSVAAGTLGVAGVAIHSQQVQTHAGAGKETFIGAGTHAQELQTSVAAGYVPFLGVVIQSQQVQTHAGEGTVTGAFNGIAAHAQEAQTHAAAGKETFPGIAVHSQQAQTQDAIGYVPFAGVVAQSQQPQTQAAAGAVPYSGVTAQSQTVQTQAATGTTPVEETETPAEVVAIGGDYTVDLRTLTATRRIMPWVQEVLAAASARQPAQIQRATGHVKQFISSKASTCQQAGESEAFAIRDYEARDQREMLEILEALVA